MLLIWFGSMREAENGKTQIWVNSKLETALRDDTYVTLSILSFTQKHINPLNYINSWVIFPWAKTPPKVSFRICHICKHNFGFFQPIFWRIVKSIMCSQVHLVSQNLYSLIRYGLPTSVIYFVPPLMKLPPPFLYFSWISHELMTPPPLLVLKVVWQM